MSRFQAGQVWQYKTRPGEESSRIIILRVQDDRVLGTIVNVQVTDVRLAAPNAPGGICTLVSHLPFAEEDLLESVTIQEDENAQPNEAWEFGYESWKSAFDAGHAGIYKRITVSDVLTITEKAMSGGVEL